jgi:hypothetical protein
LELEEKIIKIGKYELKIHELTVEEEAEIKSESRVYDKKLRTSKLDSGALDASIILHSVVKETWPSDFGEMSLDNIRKLPSKYFRRLLIESQKLNSVPEEIADFLEERSSSAENKQSSEQQSGSAKHV